MAAIAPHQARQRRAMWQRFGGKSYVDIGKEMGCRPHEAAALAAAALASVADAVASVLPEADRERARDTLETRFLDLLAELGQDDLG